jgi:hypothetical protein
MYILFSPLNELSFVFIIVRKFQTPIMNFTVALSKHVDASSCWTKTFAKVRTQMFFDFLFPCASNLCGTQHCLELSCTHLFADGNSLIFTGSENRISVKA